MELHTTRFGTIQVKLADMIRFPGGIPGLAGSLDWVLLHDTQHQAFGWLQSYEFPAVALAVVGPRRFMAGYRVRVARRELASVHLDRIQDAHILVIVAKHGSSLTLNLKAPLVINFSRRLGCQVVTKDEYPYQYSLEDSAVSLKKTA